MNPVRINWAQSDIQDFRREILFRTICIAKIQVKAKEDLFILWYDWGKFRSYFTTVSQLVEELRRAHHANRLDAKMRQYLRPRILVVDEVGYLPLDPLAAKLFFQLISTRYERGSLILTSNKSFGEWGELFVDSVLASAILDRLLHHAHIVNIRGQSYRLKDKMKTGVYSTSPEPSGSSPKEATARCRLEMDRNWYGESPIFYREFPRPLRRRRVNFKPAKWGKINPALTQYK